MEAIHDPRIIFLQFEHSRPGLITFHRQGFIFWFEVDRSLSPRIIGERAPFCRDQWRVIAILARSHYSWMLIELKSDFCFERQARAFEDDLWSQFVSHKKSITD